MLEKVYGRERRARCCAVVNSPVEKTRYEPELSGARCQFQIPKRRQVPVSPYQSVIEKDPLECYGHSQENQKFGRSPWIFARPRRSASIAVVSHYRAQVG